MCLQAWISLDCCKLHNDSFGAMTSLVSVSSLEIDVVLMTIRDLGQAVAVGNVCVH